MAPAHAAVVLARRLAVARLVLRTHLGLMLGAVLIPEVGKAVRLIAEQAGHLLGRGLTADAPDEFLLFLHLAAMFLLGVALWQWGNGAPWTRRFFVAAAVAMLPLAPAGLPLAGLLFWLARRPEFEEASEQMPQIAGSRRALFVTAWVVATVAGAVAALGAFLLMGMMPLLWLPALLGATLPAAATILWMMAPRQRANDMVESAMPRLPEIVGQQYP